MNIEQIEWKKETGWLSEQRKLADSAQLVLLFGEPDLIRRSSTYDEIKAVYPGAYVFGCSTGGNIFGSQILDETMVGTAIDFNCTKVAGAHIVRAESSYIAGHDLARAIPHEDLDHVLVLSDGLNVNGNQFMMGLLAELPDHVAVTGGLAGDGNGFRKTYVISNETTDSHMAAILGFYGRRLKVAYSTQGGWDAFGPERLVTRSRGNVLYEMDGRSALELYKVYLGDLAEGLPATGMYFPLYLRSHEGDIPVTRTVIGIKKDDGLIFGGDIPEGTYVRLMRANYDRLIDSAHIAAEKCIKAAGKAELALLVSCTARRLVLKQRTEEEVEAAQQAFGSDTIMTGFYSMGEISPHRMGCPAGFHNQTMSITTFTEE
ncbi:MAG: FIST N-terminal domain-containing protein [Syntrophomonas sp.]